jgi:hypothetical protein
MMISQDLNKELAIAEAADRHSTSWKKVWGAFVVVGLILYAGVYFHAESLVMEYGQHSRWFMTATAPKRDYDIVILGASHAMPFAYDDMNEALEEATDTSIINLSIEGGGVVPARFNLDYFLADHTTKNVVYVLDSFVFYSRQWNEDRINDPKLTKRAPFDLDLAKTMWKYPAARDLLPGYVSGFYKINNADRYAPDVAENEGKAFDKVYKANAMIDRQRLKYLFPAEIDQNLVNGYMAQFKELAEMLKQRGIKLTVIRTPLPTRVSSKMKGEAEFNARIQAILTPLGFEMHDFSNVDNEEGLYYDTDHLNRAGVANFMDNHLVDVLKTLKPAS